MVWIGILMGEKTKLCIVDRTVAKEKCIFVLEINMLTFAYLEHSLRKKGFIFMKDNHSVNNVWYCKVRLKNMNMARLP